MDHKCKRIIDGKTYNTETATRVAGWDEREDHYTYGKYLYQTRFGAFFEYSFLDSVMDDDHQTISPLSPEDARKWLEERVSWDPELIEKLFGEMPEAGSGEARLTVRLPESLRNRLATRADENKQSLNAWIVRCLERCAKQGEDA